MQPPNRPANEIHRLQALREFQILDSESEEDFDQIAGLASFICKTPMSAITLIDEHRQWIKANVGLQDKETPRDVSFCAHAILADEMLVVPDATKDVRFAMNPLVTGSPDIRFYAGMPLTSSDGYNLGAICVIDTEPRSLTPDQNKALGVLRNQVLKLLELRRANRLLNNNNNLQKKLLSIIGHDLRSPVNSMLGLVAMHKGLDLSISDYRQVLDHVGSKLDDANRLLLNLLEWAKNNIEGKELVSERLPLLRTIREVVEPIVPSIREKQNSIKISIPESIEVNVAKNLFAFVIRNLIVNANKFTEQGEIQIIAVASDDKVVIDIMDTGVGIAPEIINSLFHWGNRSSTKGTRGEIGSGLGLPMVNEFVIMMGGNIRCSSNERGSVFTIMLASKMAR